MEFIKFIFELHFGGSKINTRVVPFSIVGVGKLLDYIYMKKCICQNLRDVPFSKSHIQLKLSQALDLVLYTLIYR